MNPRPWLIAVATVYVPIVAPLFMGPLTECDHCVANYARHAPMVPSFWLDHTVIVLSGFKTMPEFGSAAGTALRLTVCLAMVGLVRWLLTKKPPVAWTGCVLLATLVGFYSVGFSVLLRM